MGSVVISFRFDDEEVDLLKLFSNDNESPNQTAARIVREAIGATLKKTEKQEVRKTLHDEIESIVDERLKRVIDNCQQIVDERIQELQRQIEEMKKSLPESVNNTSSKRRNNDSSTVKKSTKSNSEVIK